MLFLYVFADNIEALVGHVRFFFFYFLGGLSAVLLQTIMDWDSTIPMVGASGCISAVLGAYLVMLPRSKVKLMFFFFVRFWVPAVLFLVFWAAQQFMASFGSIAKTQDTGGVAYWAHIGGFVFGVAAGVYFRLTRKYK
jgi:membrane associated rhomboid family serine protease